jgi:hypothetical protein
MTQERETKKQLRALRKLKRQTQPHSPERLQLNRQIRTLKKELVTRDEILKPDVEKQALIDALNRLYACLNRPMLTDFRIYTIDQLAVHLKKVKGG